MASVPYWAKVFLLGCMLVGVISEPQKRYENNGVNKRELSSLRSELALLKRQLLEDLERRTMIRNTAAREAGRRDFEGIEEMNVKRSPDNDVYADALEKQRDLWQKRNEFSDVEKAKREHNLKRDFGVVRDERNEAKWRALDENINKAKAIRDFEGIEEMRNAKSVRDKEKRSDQTARDVANKEKRASHDDDSDQFWDVEEKKRYFNDDMHFPTEEKRGFEEQHANYFNERENNDILKDSLSEHRRFFFPGGMPQKNKRIPLSRNTQRGSDVYYDSSEIQKRERFLGRRDPYDTRELNL